jgi:hypothetical protein
MHILKILFTGHLLVQAVFLQIVLVLHICINVCVLVLYVSCVHLCRYAYIYAGVRSTKEPVGTGYMSCVHTLVCIKKYQLGKKKLIFSSR